MNVAFVGYLVGAVLSIIIPFALAFVEENQPFEWRKIVGRLIAVALTLVPILGGQDFWQMLDSLAGNSNLVMVFFAATTSGYGISEIGNVAQKAYRLSGRQG